MDTKSPHILNTSANLLGFTFIVMTSIKALGVSSGGTLDRMVGICVILFALSALLSFMSMRVRAVRLTKQYEWLADMIFLVGLILCLVLSILLALDVAKL